MFARVFDKENQRYYKSIVYCAIDQGYYLKYIVLNPYTNNFELIDYLDKSSKQLIPLVEIIQNDCEQWVCYEKINLLKLKFYCKEHSKNFNVNYLYGYKDVCENFEFLTSIFESKVIPVDKVDICIRTLSDTEIWNYVLTEEDADNFMELFAGFHDSTLDKLVYEDDYSSPKVVAVFDNSGWYGIIEICFEGVWAVNIRPPKENFSGEIYGATLIIKDESVFWADSYGVEEENLSYEGNYIKALNMKWRKIG